MPASLYQSAVSGSAGCAAATATTWLFSRNTEDVRGQRVRVQLHEIMPPAPGVMAGGDEVVQLIGVRGRAIEVDPARLRISRIEIHRDQNQVIARLLRVADELLVVRRMEAQAPVALQRGVLLAYVVEPRDEWTQAVRPLALPALDLVLLGVQVFLASRLARRIVHQLERRAIHPVVRCQRAREYQSGD